MNLKGQYGNILIASMVLCIILTCSCNHKPVVLVPSVTIGKTSLEKKFILEYDSCHIPIDTMLRLYTGVLIFVKFIQLIRGLFFEIFQLSLLEQLIYGHSFKNRAALDL